MKANAPEKIYLYPSRMEKGVILNAWFKTQYNQDSIEYTRADAFIKKACEFLDSQLVNDKDEVTGEPFVNFKNYGTIKETFISRFKDYMKR